MVEKFDSSPTTKSLETSRKMAPAGTLWTTQTMSVGKAVCLFYALFLYFVLTDP
jgi:hypothetical protein